MTVLEEAKEIKNLKIKVMEARKQLLICSIDYPKWLNCYNRCIKMANSSNPEIVAISQGLIKSLSDASVFCSSPEAKEELNAHMDSISKSLKISNRITSSNR